MHRHQITRKPKPQKLKRISGFTVFFTVLIFVCVGFPFFIYWFSNSLESLR